MAIIRPETYAIRPGDDLVVVLISAWQCGQIMCVVWGPMGTTVVTMVVCCWVAADGLTNGLVGGTPPTA